MLSPSGRLLILTARIHRGISCLPDQIRMSCFLDRITTNISRCRLSWTIFVLIVAISPHQVQGNTITNGQNICLVVGGHRPLINFLLRNCFELEFLLAGTRQESWNFFFDQSSKERSSIDYLTSLGANNHIGLVHIAREAFLYGMFVSSNSASTCSDVVGNARPALDSSAFILPVDTLDNQNQQLLLIIILY